jgi:hypothetical protein
MTHMSRLTKEQPAQLARWRANPVAFVEEVLIDPGNGQAL